MDWGVFAAVVGGMGSLVVGVSTMIALVDRFFVPPWKKRRQRQDAMNDLVMAQLNTNGGGSFVDKMNATRDDVGMLKITVDEMSERMTTNAAKIDDLTESIAKNHAEGQADLQGLHSEDKAIEGRLVNIERKTDGLQKMADNLGVELPKRIHMQDEAMADISALQGDVHSHGDRIDRLEREVFGD